MLDAFDVFTIVILTLASLLFLGLLSSEDSKNEDK